MKNDTFFETGSKKLSWVNHSMRCYLIFIIGVLLSGCSLEPNAASHLTRSSETSSINVVSNVNSQLAAANAKNPGQSAFYNCLATNQFKNSNTLIAFLYSTSRDTAQPLIVTVDSEVLSAYANQVWQRAEEDQNKLKTIVSLHKSQDQACFNQKLSQLSATQTSSYPKRSNLEDYNNSAKLLLQVYDYLNATLQKTDYSELSEQLAREYIPIRVLLPTS